MSRSLAHYRLGAVLGRGGFAELWSAEGPQGEVAIKISIAGGRAARARVQREVDALRRMDGRNAPRLIETGESEDGRPYLVVERLRGETLSQRLSRESPTSGGLIESARGICDALQACHDAGLVHADLKPSNVFLTTRGVHLIDFGSSVAAGGRATGAATPRYAAPEQLRGETLSPATDIYSLATLTFELLTGATPFVDDFEYGHLMLRPPGLRDCPPELADAIEQALDKAPERRPTIAAIRAALELSGSETATAGPPVAEFDRTEARVIAGIEARGNASALAEAIAAGGAELVDFSGEWLIACFPPDAAAVERAANLAEEWTSRLGVRVGLHIARVRELHASAGDRALVAPREWLTAHDGKPVWETETFALARGTGTPRPPLVGRTEELEAAAEILSTAIAEANPGVLLVRASRGVGRTRFAEELRRRVATSCGDCHVQVVDDAERLTESEVRRIESSAVPGGTCAAALIADPEWIERRPQLLSRAGWLRELELRPLDTSASQSLLLSALSPVERVSDEFLTAALPLIAGRPGRALQLAGFCRSEGWIVRRPRGERWDIDSRALEALRGSSHAQWLTSASVAALPEDLADFASLCATLGPRYAIDELSVLREDARVDCEVGAVQLLARGVLERDGDGYRFRDALLREALSQRIDAERLQMVRTRLLAHLEVASSGAAQTWDAAERRADLLAQLGRPRAAAAELRRLGREALVAHRPWRAEELLTRSLELEPDDIRALVTRGSCRYRIDRPLAAADDLGRAEELAREADELQLATEAALELATALDWASSYLESRAAAERGARLLARAPDPGLEARAATALGRAHLRHGDLEAAARELERGAADGAAVGDYDARIVALLLLGPVLTQMGELERAGSVFRHATEICSERGDLVHLAAAIGNRVSLQLARGDLEAAKDDLSQARRLAIRAGHAVPERNTTYNFAEYLYWSGEDEAALELARRSRDLQERLVGSPVEDTLLLARIHASRDEASEAAEMLRAAMAMDSDWPPPLLALGRLSRLIVSGSGSRREWDVLEEECASLLGDDGWLEAVYWRARLGDADARDRGRKRAGSGIWSRRFAALSRGGAAAG